jgi:dienelactone hydrolase
METPNLESEPRRRLWPWRLSVVLMVGIAWFLLYSKRPDPVEFFQDRRSDSTDFQIQSTWRKADVLVSALRIEGRREVGKMTHSVAFDAYYSVPEDPAEQVPAFLLVGGLETGRDAMRVISERPDIASLGAFITLDYPYSGKLQYKRLEFVKSIPAIKRALYDGVEAIRLCIDFLETQGDVDPDRIVLFGVSLGAFYVVDAGGVDERPAAVMSFMGGGNLRALLEWNLRRGGHLSSRWLSVPTAYLAAWMIQPLEPLNLVGGISPGHYIQVSARNDHMIPERCALSLFEAAKEPRSLVWMPAPHVMPGMEEIIDQMVEIAWKELERIGLLQTDPF